jgi:methylglutaconyl-CoA hydratase
MEQPVLIEIDRAARTTTLILNRPHRRNALNLPMLRDLRVAIIDARAREPSQQRALILTGAEPVFCSGLDLAEAASAPREALEAVRDALLELARCPLITIAAVRGAAIGGGAGLVAACDFAVMADDARFGFPEVRRGLVPALVAVFLRHQLRERDVRELLLGGELLPASRALAMGFVNRLAPGPRVIDEAREIAAAILQGGPETMAATKKLLADLRPRSLEEDCRLALEAHDATHASGEAREGAAAFLAKRLPVWASPPD